MVGEEIRDESWDYREDVWLQEEGVERKGTGLRGGVFVATPRAVSGGRRLLIRAEPCLQSLAEET